MTLSDDPVQVAVLACYEPREECGWFFGGGDTFLEAEEQAKHWAALALGCDYNQLDIQDTTEMVDQTATVPASIAQDIDAVLELNWADEQTDFEQEWGPEHGDDSDGHIFQAMQRIDKWLRSVKRVPART